MTVSKIPLYISGADPQLKEFRHCTKSLLNEISSHGLSHTTNAEFL